MPDIVVELLEPWDDGLAGSALESRSRVYLRKGTSLFWLVRPAERGIDVSCKDTAGRMQTESLGIEDKLSGHDILPGFELPVSDIFAVLRD